MHQGVSLSLQLLQVGQSPGDDRHSEILELVMNDAHHVMSGKIRTLQRRSFSLFSFFLHEVLDIAASGLCRGGQLRR